MINASLPIVEVKDKENNKKEIEEDLSLTITGIDQDSKYIKVLDDKEKAKIQKKYNEWKIIHNKY